MNSRPLPYQGSALPLSYCSKDAIETTACRHPNWAKPIPPKVEAFGFAMPGRRQVSRQLSRTEAKTVSSYALSQLEASVGVCVASPKQAWGNWQGLAKTAHISIRRHDHRKIVLITPTPALREQQFFPRSRPIRAFRTFSSQFFAAQSKSSSNVQRTTKLT